MKKVLTFMLSIMVMLASMSAIAASAVNNVTVDSASVIRDVTHCASGSLYGITETVPADINSLVAPLKPYVMRNPARSGAGTQHWFGAAAIPVSKRLAGIPSAKVSIDLADMLPGWPYQFKSMTDWLNKVKAFIDDKKVSGRTNYYGYEIWNEPDGTWNNANGSFENMWLQTFKTIRANDPTEKIIGPCYSYYNHNTLSKFLSFCKANNCLPDIMSWHELSGIQNVSNNLKDYRTLESSLGISARPISINEYCDANHNLEGQPGSAAQFIGKFERYKVDSACISWWFVPKPGRLGSLLATDTQKGAGWYLFKWYGDMTGKMVNVTPPKDASTLVDGAACVDAGAKYMSFIFGGGNDGTINTTFKNIPSFIGSTASVKVEKIDWTSKDTVSHGPSTISTSNYSVVNGQITVTLKGCNASSGYRIYITPGTSSGNEIVSGKTYKLINRNSGKLLDVDNKSTADGGNVIQWADNGGNNQRWVIVSTDNGYILKNVNSNKLLDVDNGSTADGGNVIQWTTNGNNNQKWNIFNLGNGYYKLLNINSGKALDVYNNSTTDGADVVQWTDNSGTNQQWQLVQQ
ncbi:RICIN domain-containing protein [Clostridium sp. HBUAS56017]|uniref:RICIN domain-containing protein n=1 Tax=Clostridium sp. HBUAS56017 TaxID=2571128 RepID=UPI00163DA676|nr:RICIN domain-containing protein [Clostridium sp. HBUAS56017]